MVKMKPSKRWIQHFKDFCFTVEMFCDEIKTQGHSHSQEISNVLIFMNTITLTDCDDSLFSAMRKMVTMPAMLQAMRGGLIVEEGKFKSPGAFFKTSYNFTITNKEGAEISIDFKSMLGILSGQAKRKAIKAERIQSICLYLCNILADSIRNYLLANPGVIPNDIRENILKNTSIQDVPAPYTETHKEDTIKCIISGLIEDESCADVINGALGNSATTIAGSMIKKFNVSTFTSLREGFDKTVRERSHKPLIDVSKNMLTSMAGSVGAADDGIDPQDQC
jgi:hypothetical protein